MTPQNPFASSMILDGIRRWVEIETPTDVPAQVNKLASLVADLYRGLPATIERVAGQDGCGDHLVARSAWGQDAPGILVLSGGSDGNFTAPHTATLDGVDGKGAHTHYEQLYVSSLEPRARLLHRLYQTLR